MLAVPLRNLHGKMVKWYGTLTDIEGRNDAEQEREKLRQFEADLAHVTMLSGASNLGSPTSENSQIRLEVNRG